MPRFFFNIHDGKNLVDREGTLLADVTHARSEAVQLAGRCIAEMGADFWTHEGDWVLDVSDHTGATLFSLKFASVQPHTPQG